MRAAPVLREPLSDRRSPSDIIYVREQYALSRGCHYTAHRALCRAYEREVNNGGCFFLIPRCTLAVTKKSVFKYNNDNARSLYYLKRKNTQPRLKRAIICSYSCPSGQVVPTHYENMPRVQHEYIIRTVTGYAAYCSVYALDLYNRPNLYYLAISNYIQRWVQKLKIKNAYFLDFHLFSHICNIL